MLPQRTTKEFLVRLIYAEMLGHDASFGYVKALEMVAAGNLVEKRVGYLCASLCFSPDQPLRMMLVSRLQKDMQSANILEICFALTAACKLITKDMIGAIIGDADKLLTHEKEIVRKKTVMLLHRFLQLDPASVSDYNEKFRRALCDRNPAVMAASLHVYDELVRAAPASHKDLVPSFVSILKQVSEGRLPRDFSYHRMPAPWIQMKLLRLLATLGHADQKSSEQMYEVLLSCMGRADSGLNVGFAVLYETVRTITCIYPNTTLLDEAAACISRFISSDNHNLRYLGITSLAAIVKDHPQYATKHQMAVMRCLEDPDDTLKRKTLDLLFRMTNPANVEVIVDRLVANLRDAVDVFLRQDLVDRISEVAERFAPSTTWYVQVMTQVFELGGDLVKSSTASSVMRLIAEGGDDEDEEADNEMRTDVVETYLELIDRPGLPDMLLQTLFWVLGEYGYLAESMELPAMCDKICSLAGRAGLNKVTRGYAISAAAKLTAQVGAVVPSAQQLMDSFGASKDVDLAQRCAEFRVLASRLDMMRAVMPVDASCEDVEMEGDEGLAFLDSYVEEALAAGAQAYEKPADMAAAEAEAAAAAAGHALRFSAYATPDAGTHIPESGPSSGAGEAAGPGGLQAPAGGGLQAAAGPWGQKGQWGRKPAPAPAPAAAAPAPGFPGTLPGQRGPASGAAPPTSGAQPPVPPRPTTSLAGLREALGSTSGSGTSRMAAAAPAPREPTAEELAAQALFQGIPGAGSGRTGTSARAGGARAARRTRPRGEAAPAPAAAPAAAPTPAPPAAAAVSARQPAAAAPAPTPADDDDMVDLFGGGPAASSPAPAPAAGAASAADDDLFGGMSIGGAAPAPAGPDLTSLAASAGAAAAIAGHPRMPAKGAQRVGGDAAVTVSVAKAYRPEGLVVLVFLTNASSAALSPITLTPASVPFLTPSLAAGTGVEVSAAQAGFHPIAPGASSCVAITFVLANAPSSTTLKLNLARPGAAALSVEVPIPVTDLLRPWTMTTPEFGAKWPQLAQAKTINLDGVSVANARALLAALETARHKGIDVIEAAQECIACAKLMGTTQLALVHGKVLAPGKVTLTVKTAHMGFTEAVAAAVGASIRG